MITIDWHPTPAQLRRWAITTALGLGIAGSLFYFVHWGIFAKAQGLAPILWIFACCVFCTAGPGTKVGMPIYWVWMAFVFAVGTVIGVIALAAVFFLVVTPLAIGARLCGRDRLHIRCPKGESMWHMLPQSAHDPQRQF